MYELKEHSFEGQVEYCVDKYPKFNGTTYAIGGNHDGWHYKRSGSDVVKAIAKDRDDIVYLGPDAADLKIGKTKTMSMLVITIDKNKPEYRILFIRIPKLYRKKLKPRL